MKKRYLTDRVLFMPELRILFEIQSDIWENVENTNEPFDAILIDYSVFYSTNEISPLSDRWRDEVKNKALEISLRIKQYYTDQQIMVMVLTSAHDLVPFDLYFDAVVEELENYYPTKVTLVHPFKNIKRYRYYDIYLNYTKAYYTDYDKFNLNRMLGFDYSTKNNFLINQITHRNILAQRTFLCANRVLYNQDGSINDTNNPKMKFRKRLLDFLRGKNGYLSDFENNIILPSETENSDEYLNRVRGNGMWIPVANRIYNDSYFSVFIETTVSNSQEMITEKTFDPLLKGHFILPFGYAGIIRDLRSMGFLFPDWINYSYDTVLDMEERFMTFLNCLDEILLLSITELNDLYNRDLHILKHNQNLFYELPYDELKFPIR